MANHQSAIKRIRTNAAKRLRNRYKLKTCRTLIKELKGTTDRKQGELLLKKIFSLLDKLAKRNILHQNAVANRKASLSRRVYELS